MTPQDAALLDIETKPAPAAPKALILEIATRHFFVETLETRNSDQLDFHDVAVWAMRAALEDAFEAGRIAAAPDLHRIATEQAAEIGRLREALETIKSASKHYAYGDCDLSYAHQSTHNLSAGTLAVQP